ncbi:MAG TPA: glycosyltransferase family 39 protein [Bryobacteraceae bacterium]|nr:glycosyltransferase family 39 protein [Bryobacteraceae bacterium]
MFTSRKIYAFVFALAFFVAFAQGVVRFRRVLGARDQQFIDLTSADALMHVTLAQRILNGEGYTLPIPFGLDPQPRVEPAFLKAPGYPYLLAALFRITGISFWFFPIQCLFTGGLSVLLAAITNDVFGSPVAALYAGIGAAVHPVLVNLASQLYNENIFFFLFLVTVFLYLRWFRAPSVKRALLCGVAAGLTALIRESVLAPFAALVVLAAVWLGRKDRTAGLLSAGALAAGLAVVVLPWTVRNYVVTGVLVPISTISLAAVAMGNNSCVAAGGWTTAFYGDNPCPAMEVQASRVLGRSNREPKIVFLDRALSTVGWNFIERHPGAYLKLCFRRAWTVFDPWHPAQHLQGAKKLVMLLYFLFFIAVGVAGAAWFAIEGPPAASVVLYAVAVATYVPLVAIFVSHDHRYTVGMDLPLCSFAGGLVARLAYGRARTRPVPV